MDWTKPQSGTYATDCYRESKGQEARNALLAGHSALTVSGDHLSASELCIETIVRLGGVHKSHSDASVLDTVNKACNALLAGHGYHKKQSDHAGGNTCAAVIAASTG